MTEAEVLKQLTPVFHDVFGDDSIVLSLKMTANDIEGWDSQTHVMLTVAAEQRFGIKFRTAELESLRNVGHFAEVISKKLEAH
ncbi:acyl carrier protein [Stutzerimonas xanthomarina]|uniref:Acyl carrier protein n=2 Tax=Stutzerimonas xanthomarina TaxID=271420 RepID=A0A1M5PLJ0_9GAMM|nr:acyl carrier protein [Stutzerimonas xanthomarina]MCP9338179.1 acyl carrier protein [Stutzerimonas xanthomarina]SEH73506.1 acyl carrier protein [Stutzerimonas xanthomarina]SHH02638.1 acyl carrier protein [Stutzerimonas xanthomarina DSM 18231]